NSGSGEIPVPCGDVNGCSIAGHLGVTATPVISVERNAIYVEARSKQNGAYFHKFHALDLTTGTERFGGPVVIAASVPGTASDHDSQGKVNFNPLRENCRPGLLLVNGIVYAAFASINDVTPYHGWVLGYNADTLQQTAVFNVTPDGSAGGIWQNNGLAADSAGNIFGVAGNGTTPPSSNNYGQAYVKLTPQGGQLAVSDYFAPFNGSALNSTDLDVGSGGLLPLPDQSGPHPHLLVAAGKEGRIYLVDRDNMGKYQSGDDSQIVQSIPNAVGGSGERNFYPPVFWNGNVYFSGANDVIKAFSLQNGLLSTTPVMQSGTAFSFPGAGMIVSAKGNSGAILWALEWHASSHLGTLHAYDPGNLSHEFWTSDQSGSRDTLGTITRLNVPTVINGKVYVSGISSVTVFGLLP
ncbi:MAG TPA: hypothetical protein VI685_27770, partial [Candidatus Angelobacter sp.]